jgi:hypothetical protein
LKDLSRNPEGFTELNRKACVCKSSSKLGMDAEINSA